MLWSPNTQLHYPFENTALDYSGLARHGTIYGSGVFATKPGGGRCLYFDGVGDYVATPSFGLSGTVVVFAADVRCKSNVTVNQAFIGDGSAHSSAGYLYIYRFLNTDNLRFRYAEGTSNAIYAEATDYFSSPYNNAWLYLCVVCDYSSKYVYFYRDGIPFGSPVAMTGTPVFPSTNRVKYVGSYGGAAQFLTDGSMANVKLGTLATMPPLAAMTANANRLMLGMNPIWSV